MTAPISSNSPETPLARNQYLRYLALATVLIALFYIFCLLALGLGILAWCATALVGVLGIQYGGSVILGVAVMPLGRVLLAFARSLKIGRGKEFRIALTRDEAPRLWSEIDELARIMGVTPPRQITLENGVNAWVELRGVAAGRGKTRLGVGLDLLVGLTPAQGRAVLAHEIAHAKHVKRGYQGFLMRGFWRLERCRATLESIAGYQKNAKGVRALARNANKIPVWLGERAGRLIAACSRFDEFEADREAALICGSDVAKNALLTTHVLAERASRLSYRERLIHLGRGDVAWLEKQLHVADDNHRLAIENQALSHARRHELSTHPALPDRLSALEALPCATVPFAPDAASETFWLARSGESSRRLLEEIEKLAARQEREETRALARRMKKRIRDEKNQSKRKAGAHPVEGVVAFVLGTLLGGGTIFSWNIVNGHDLSFLCFMAILSLGFYGYAAWSLWPRARHSELSVFPYGAYRQALELRGEQRREIGVRSDAAKNLNDSEKRRAQMIEDLEREEERVALSAALRATLPPEIQTSAALMRFWNEKGFEILAQAAFRRAALCARLSFEAQRKNNPNAWLVHGVCLAFHGQSGAKESIETALKHDTGWSSQWARALWLLLIGSWGSAEALLLELCRQRPKDSTLVALLATCQSSSGKAREALLTRRRALQLYQVNSHSEQNDEAWYRFDLARSLIALGQTKAAREELSWVETHRTEDNNSIGVWNLEWELLCIAIAHGDEVEVTTRIARLIELRDDPFGLLRIASLLAGDRTPFSQQRAKFLYEKLVTIGHYPQARMGLAWLFIEEHEKDLARKNAMAALDCLQSRPFDASNPLSLLGSALQVMRSLDESPPSQVQAYEAQLDASEWQIGPDKITLLCFFENENETRRAASRVFGALLPECDLEDHITVKKVTDENLVPKEPMVPAITDFKTE